MTTTRVLFYVCQHSIWSLVTSLQRSRFRPENTHQKRFIRGPSTKKPSCFISQSPVFLSKITHPKQEPIFIICTDWTPVLSNKITKMDVIFSWNKNQQQQTTRPKTDTFPFVWMKETTCAKIHSSRSINSEWFPFFCKNFLVVLEWTFWPSLWGPTSVRRSVNDERGQKVFNCPEQRQTSQYKFLASEEIVWNTSLSALMGNCIDLHFHVDYKISASSITELNRSQVNESAISPPSHFREVHFFTLKQKQVPSGETKGTPLEQAENSGDGHLSVRVSCRMQNLIYWCVCLYTP